jgi:hypothetical protein
MSLTKDISIRLVRRDLAMLNKETKINQHQTAIKTIIQYILFLKKEAKTPSPTGNY